MSSKMGSIARMRHDLLSVLQVIDTCHLVVPDVVVRAVIAAEDRRFNGHLGVDFYGVTRAIYRFVFMERVEGASTIEAQLWRTVSGRRDISISRKLNEMIGAFIISRLRSKEDIVNAYLNVAYFGFRKNGIRFAAERLGIDLDNPSVIDACNLAARLKRPSSRPLEDPSNGMLRRRVDWILSLIGNEGGSSARNGAGVTSMQ